MFSYFSFAHYYLDFKTLLEAVVVVGSETLYHSLETHLFSDNLSQIQYAAREGDHLNIVRATARHAVAEAKGAWTKY